jgi:hypothetical protein
VLPIAIITNVMNLVHININLITLISVVLIYISIEILLNNQLHHIDFKFIFCIFIILLIIGSIDLTFYKLLFNITNRDLKYLQTHIFEKMIFGVFPRFIEFTCIGILLYKNNINIKTNVVKEIFKNKSILILCCIWITLITSTSIFFCQNIIMGNIMKYYNDYYKELAILGAFIFSILNILFSYFITTFIQLNERKKYKFGE